MWKLCRSVQEVSLTLNLTLIRGCVLGPQLKRLPSPKKSTDDMGASREGQGILALLENVLIRFALVATFWFVQKEPKIVATTDMFHWLQR